MRPLTIALALFSLLTGSASAQEKNINRRFIPIVLHGSQLPLADLAVSEWSAFRYSAAAGQWHAVPFQVDEVYQGKYNKREFIDGIMDDDDELLVMPSALGDRASAWLEDDGARMNERIELEFIDPLNSARAWLYLYRGAAAPIPAADTAGVFEYLPAPSVTPAADTVRTHSYVLGHDANGWINYLALLGNDPVDVLDRIKFRLAGNPTTILLGPYEINENMLEAKDDPVTFHPGRLRAFHDERAYIDVPITMVPKGDADYQLQYTPYSFRIELDKFGLNKSTIALAGVQLLRISIDLNDRAHGMTFHSSRNKAGFEIDGQPDAPDLTLDPASKLHWLTASGPNGVIILLLEMPEIPNSEVQIYYRDDAGGGTADGTEDTGDRRSNGDMGLWIRAKGRSLETDEISLKLNAFFINEPGLDAAFGDTLVAWELNPLELQARLQSWTPARVSEFDRPVSGYRTSQAYPNPFRREANSLQIKVDGPWNGGVLDVTVYNLLGQSVAHFRHPSPAQKGEAIITWDGLDFGGAAAPAGTYFLRARGTGMEITRKFMILE